MLSSSQPDSNESFGADGRQERPESVKSDIRELGLDGILEQILSAAENDPQALRDPSGDKFREELLAIARNLKEYEFCFDPVLLAMVNVVAGQMTVLPVVQRQAMQKSVAASIYEDISARERLERLWGHLVRLASNAE